MVKVVRQFAGDGWMPSAIRLDSGSPESLLRAGAGRDAELSLNHDAMAISIPSDLLDRRLPPARSANSRFVGEHNSPIAPQDFLGAMHTALDAIVSVEKLSIELGAEIAGTSPRTLRRWLHQEGTTWRRVVDGVRLERSVRLLLNSPLSLAEISFEIGYSDAAHFTRAFQRWTGEGPRAYRRRRLIQ
jgi:AraC-like DNA-binding protein